MALTKSELLELHNKAVNNLKIKVGCIPARAFTSGRKPTIRDIYERPASIANPEIHPNLQLDFVFSHYNEIAAAGFRARKLGQDNALTMAIFYWQMDLQHSLSTFHKEIRFNLVLAHIFMFKPSAKDEMEPQLYRFLEYFLMAWLDFAMRIDHSEDPARDYFIVKVWKTSKYDFVHWPSKALDRMRRSIRALEAKLPACSHTAEEFWAKAGEMPVEEWKKHGTAWAMQYVVLLESKNKGYTADVQASAAVASLQTGDFASSFSGLGMADGPPEYLCEELFQQDLVQALLVDIEDVEVQAREEFTSWMNSSKAIDLIEGVDVGEIIEMMTSSLLIF
jgi:hypothetical protein